MRCFNAAGLAYCVLAVLTLSDAAPPWLLQVAGAAGARGPLITTHRDSILGNTPQCCSIIQISPCSILSTGACGLIFKLITFRRWGDETACVPRFLVCFMLMVAELSVENGMVW